MVCSMDVSSDFEKFRYVSMAASTSIFISSKHLVGNSRDILEMSRRLDRQNSQHIGCSVGKCVLCWNTTYCMDWMDGWKACTVYPLALFNHKLTQTGLPSTLCAHCSGL